MDRKKEILEKISEEIEMLVYKNTQEAEIYFNENKEEIEKDFCETMKNLFEYANKAQVEYGKDKIKFLCINSLYSTVLTGSYEFLFSLKNSSIYMDKVEAETYWTPSFVFKNIDEDMVQLEEVIKSHFTRVSDFELSEVKYDYAVMHSAIVLKYIFELAFKVKEQEFFNIIDMEEDFEILFSLHMEKAFPIAL